ncbi:MAG: rhomboid family intramembrane serine protease [bacterium]
MGSGPGSMLCPNCRKLVSVAAEKCPHCGAKRPGLYGLGPGLSRLFGGRIDAVALITPVCIVLYVIGLLLDPRAAFRSPSIFRLLSPGGQALDLLGATSPWDLVNGHWWTVLTAIYLHGGLLHIAFNLMWVRQLAPEVERAFGSARFFVIWTVAGGVGFLASAGLPILGIGRAHGSIGASGAIFGLLAALIVYGRTVGASMMTRQIWQWAIILAVFGFVVPGVDNFAHLGGFAGGWIAAKALGSGRSTGEGRGTVLLATALLGLTLFGFGAQLLQVLSALTGHH